MKLLKAKFLIQLIDGAPQKFLEVEGYVDEKGRFGFHHTETKKWWVAADLSSGMLIFRAKTRKECTEFVEQHQGKIVAAKGSELYHMALRNIVAYKKNLIENEKSPD